MTPQTTRAEIARLAVAAVAATTPPDAMPGACLYLAYAVGRRLRLDCGVRALLQAGSMRWPCARPEDDDGVSPTHFSYEWEPDSAATRAAIAAGLTPEVHCWIVLPAEREVIDLSTRWFPEQARRNGIVWRVPAPPAFLWSPIDALPPRVSYEASLSACLWAAGALSRILDVDVASAIVRPHQGGSE